MPFSGYDNFAACVADQKAKGKSDEVARKICGALQARTEKEKQMREPIEVAKQLGKFLVEKGLSHDDLRYKLQQMVEGSDGKSLVAEGSNDVWVLDVFDTYFIYGKGEKLYRCDYSVEDGNVTLNIDAAVEVTKVVEYRPVEG